MNSDMSKRTSDFSVPNINWARVRATSVLPTPVGPRNKNEPIGRFGLFRPARERRTARARAIIALSCEMMRLCSSSSMRSSFCDSSSLIETIGTPVQRDTTSSMSSRPTTPVDDELDPLLDFCDLLGQRGLAQLHARPRLVDQVNRLVRQEAIRNVAVGMRNREVDSLVGVSDRVELLVAVLNAEQNLGGIAFIRRRNLDGLETALQRTIFFDRLAILARRSRADTLNFTARQSWFQDVRRIERPLGRTRAN